MPASKKKAASKATVPKDPRIRVRPHKLNDHLIKRVASVLLSAPGAAYEVIAGALRINPDTFYDWMHSGKADIKAGKPSTLCARFYTQVEAAKYQGEIDLIKEIRRCAPTFILSRRCPERWPSERMQMELSGPGGKPFAAPIVNFVQATVTHVHGQTEPFTYSDESGSGIITPGEKHEVDPEGDLEQYRKAVLEEPTHNRTQESRNTVPGRLNEVLRTTRKSS